MNKLLVLVSLFLIGSGCVTTSSGDKARSTHLYKIGQGKAWEITITINDASRPFIWTAKESDPECLTLSGGTAVKEGGNVSLYLDPVGQGDVQLVLRNAALSTADKEGPAEIFGGDTNHCPAKALWVRVAE